MTCMLLDYEQNHMVGTYHMLNIGTKPILLSHEIICLNKTYGNYVLRQ